MVKVLPHLPPLLMHFSRQCMPAAPPHATPHSSAVVCRGGALCTLSAFDIAQQVDRIFTEPVPAGWKTQAKPAVTAFAWASPRVGNYSFLKVGNSCFRAASTRLPSMARIVPVALARLGGAAFLTSRLCLEAHVFSYCATEGSIRPPCSCQTAGVLRQAGGAQPAHLQPQGPCAHSARVRLLRVKREVGRAGHACRHAPTRHSLLSSSAHYLLPCSSTHQAALSALLAAAGVRAAHPTHALPLAPPSPCRSFWVQLLTFLADKVGLNVYADTESGAGRAFAWLYYLTCSLFARLGITSK